MQLLEIKPEAILGHVESIVIAPDPYAEIAKYRAIEFYYEEIAKTYYILAQLAVKKLIAIKRVVEIVNIFIEDRTEEQQRSLNNLLGHLDWLDLRIKKETEILKIRIQEKPSFKAKHFTRYIMHLNKKHAEEELTNIASQYKARVYAAREEVIKAKHRYETDLIYIERLPKIKY